MRESNLLDKSLSKVWNDLINRYRRFDVEAAPGSIDGQINLLFQITSQLNDTAIDAVSTVRQLEDVLDKTDQSLSSMVAMCSTIRFRRKPDEFDDIERWCSEHLACDYVSGYMKKGEEFFFAFANPNEAVHFKLRWGEVGGGAL